MLEEANQWLKYAQENIEAARLLLESELYNPCLHNVQQAIEKALKSVVIEKSIPFKKTHHILELKTLLEKNGISIELTEDECDFLDSIYLPTKYPMGSALLLLERRLNTPLPRCIGVNFTTGMKDDNIIIFTLPRRYPIPKAFGTAGSFISS